MSGAPTADDNPTAISAASASPAPLTRRARRASAPAGLPAEVSEAVQTSVAPVVDPEPTVTETVDAGEKNAPVVSGRAAPRRAGRRAGPAEAAVPMEMPDAAEASRVEPDASVRRGRRAAAPAQESIPAADSAAEGAAPSASVPATVAASLVAPPRRPHAQPGGRRAAATTSDAIERPAGGRRALISAPTPAPALDATEPVESVVIDTVIVPAASAEESGETDAASAVVVPDVAEPAAGVIAAPDVVAPVKPVSRRSLRTAGPQAPTDTPDIAAAATPAAPEGSHAASEAAPVTGRRSRRGSIAKGTLSIVALLFATGIAVATSMPASAWQAASDSSAESLLADVAPVVPAQQLTTAADASGSSVARDGYGVRDVAALKAAGYRVADTFTNNPNGTIQWPFPVGVPISDGYGPRESPGGIGSTDHKGVDFTPGQGTAIQAIADGVVSTAVRSDSGGLGVYVILDHVIDGRKISTVYGHMLTGSIEVTEGQVVKVGQTIGKVGNTGTSTGAHLHLEVRLDGVTPVDPFAWLEANAN